MNEFVNRILAWHNSRDRGASAVEYALILGFIVALLVGGLFYVGNRAHGLLQTACTNLAGSC